MSPLLRTNATEIWATGLCAAGSGAVVVALLKLAQEHLEMRGQGFVSSHVASQSFTNGVTDGSGGAAVHLVIAVIGER
ncbi:hypothetical protein [Tardiphaga alba]|uniref:hypothetical protein n=1 Tax=Tardiphaga alba TaxID=340268 RepID=UPI001BAA3505|nr:hypothetical protein [Tardiphaga alba]